ncbi:hypothetical protein CROQUDRAFT_101402 [Cronartium quercuum f. sp. fusiforme G11]|uniref:Uncharacterized protein n=1 Tax=Cronartium quercuum f. sp. fusiforme G11 TaxID=708437 RepID=A0A9P6N5D5_9BASI|nr:hypothetical protein CROQUDRAFT_101402 [Cronartium quercuum f. sp. fusiforme G11]
MPETHPSPIHLLLRKDVFLIPQENEFKAIYPYPDPPWRTPKWMIHNLGEKREKIKKEIQDQIHKEKDKNAYITFTDRSFTSEEGGGTAAATIDRVTKITYGLAKGISNYEMEAMGAGISDISTLVWPLSSTEIPP